ARGDRRFRRDDVERILVEDARASETDQPADRVERAAELATFERVAAGLAATPTPASVARALVEALRTEMHVARVAVYARVEDVFELMAHAGFDEPPSGSRTLDVAPDAGSDNHEIPLATRKGTLGILIVDAPSADRMSPAFVRAVSMTVATALASARLVVHARQELGRVRALRSVTKELTGTLDLERVLDDIIERTRTLFAADRAGIWLLDGTPHSVALVTRGLSDEFLTHSAALTVSSDTISIRAQRAGRTRWMRNADRDPSVGEMRDAYAAEGIRTVCLAPLLSRGTALGVIGLYHDSDRTWPDEEVDLAQAFADQAAIAIQNARLYRSVADQAARMGSIQDLSARLNGLTDVRSIGEAIVAEARALAEYHDIRVYRVDWDRRVCEPIAFTREMIDEDLDDLVGRLRVEVGEGLTGWAAEHGEPLLVNDALEDERSKTIEGTEDVEESMLVVPMLYEGRALGVIVLSQLGFNRFSTDDLQTMTIFAGYAAQAMANAVSYEQMVSQAAELARRADSQRRLLEINERLLSTLDPTAVLETIAEGLQSVVSYDSLIICHLDREARVLRPVLARDAHVAEVMDHVMPLGQGLTSWAVEHHEPLLINDALSDPRALQIPGTPVDPEAIIIVPLIVDGEVVGALNIGRLGLEEAHFSQTDFELVQLFAGQASIAMRNATEHHAMSQRAETDALTGLGNHGAFQQELARLVDGTASAATGKAGRLAVLMMDLDAFKGYNDRHGHPAGDALLHEVATAIYGAAR
ncbi:MAG: GAF domain-containing protein, partial [Chloroflexi bacterium]|nr:GAF domain-containing protein [Chloroflexota bacterium]